MSKWPKAQVGPIYYDKRAYCFHAYIDFNAMHVRYLTSLQGSRITVLHDEISHNGLGVKVIVMAMFGVRVGLTQHKRVMLCL